MDSDERCANSFKPRTALIENGNERTDESSICSYYLRRSIPLYAVDRKYIGSATRFHGISEAARNVPWSRSTRFRQ